MKLILFTTLFFITNFTMASNIKMLGVEASFPDRGFQLAEYTFESGKYANYHFNTGVSIGPVMEYPLSNNFSLKYSVKFQYQKHNLKQFNRILTRYSIPADAQINYRMFEYFKIGAGAHLSFNSRLNDTHPSELNDLNSELQVDKYIFNNSISPIISMTLFVDQFPTGDVLFNRFALILSYTFHNYSIKNYNNNMLLENTIMDDGKFIISLGNLWAI